jgi:hypothetical protein
VVFSLGSDYFHKTDIATSISKIRNTLLSHVTHFRRTGLAGFMTDDDDNNSGNTAVLGARVRGWTAPDFLRAHCPHHIGGKANVSSLDDISG